LNAPQAQTCPECNQVPDLQIRNIRLEPDPPGVDQSYNVHVEIANPCAEAGADTWTYLYINRAPSGDPDLQAIAPTAGLGTGQSIEAHFTVTRSNATAGWHTLSVRIDAQNNVPNEACGGEGNNEAAISFNIEQVYPTDTPTPTHTAIPAPEIFFFTPDSATVARGDPVELAWQVNGQAVTVYLDGELMPLAHTHVVYPTENHVYVLRAENPGGFAEEISQITIVEPTATPTITPTPCNLPVIHEFGASPSSVVRGETVTIYWDVSGARQVFLNGGGVEGVSSKSFRLDQTKTFVLKARNDCGEVIESLTVQAKYATPTNTLVPTATRTPTRTATPTRTPRIPTSTPTRNMLPTFTPGPGTPTVTPTATATATSPAFQSPVGPGTPTWTPTWTPTFTSTPTLAATSAITQSSTLTAQPTETQAPPTATLAPPTAVSPTATLVPTATPVTLPTSTAAVIVPPRATTVPDISAADATATALALTPTATPTQSLLSTGGSIRAYLCPLSVLLLFAIGVLILSIVMPRVQERRQGFETFQHAVSVYGIVDQKGGAADGSNPGPGAGTPADGADAPAPPEGTP
jgi:hypothetical protein